MAFGIFIHRADSIYDDSPANQYQFPSQYYSRAAQTIGDWIVYYEPTKVRNSRGYYAVAKVANIVPDPFQDNMLLAVIEPGTYLEFGKPVPLIVAGGYVERGMLNAEGRPSGRAQAAIRTLSDADFQRIVALGTDDDDDVLPRVDSVAGESAGWRFDEEQMPYEVERERVSSLTSRSFRDRVFRQVVLRAYDRRCAITGLQLINGGGRAEVEAAHIRPVEAKGPDIIHNGIALSGTVHWMFDRGLLTVEDDMSIRISRQVNDRDSVEGLINPTGRLVGPPDLRDRPHPMFLAWHREHCFKC